MNQRKGEAELHENRIEFELYGGRALFSDPITRVGGEKLSYPVPTYEALKGVVQSIYWKPTIVWIVDAVRIMDPISTESVGVRPISYISDKNGLSYYTYLRNVRYRVRAHFEWNLNRPELAGDRDENKHHNIARRMVARGGRRDIFLGTRECQGYVEPCVFDEGSGAYDDREEIDFGFMYHGITYADEATLDEDRGGITVRFFHAVMKRGVIEFPRPEKCTTKRRIKDMEIKPFGLGDNFSGAGEFSTEDDG